MVHVTLGQGIFGAKPQILVFGHIARLPTVIPASAVLSIASATTDRVSANV